MARPPSYSGNLSMNRFTFRLPDMEGTKLLSKLRSTKPKMRKIIVAGYPTLQNAMSAVNKGADSYVMKPFEVEKILQTIQAQLKKQEEESASVKIKSSSSSKHALKH